MRALPFGFLGPRGPSAQCEEGWGPPLRSSHDAGAPPCTPAYYFTMRGATPLCTPRGEGAPPLRPRVTFPSRGKSPKARQGLRPLESPGAWSPPFSRSLTHRAGLPSATKIDRFATLRWWANRSCFFLWFHQGNTLCFQSVARQGFPRGCLKVSVPATNTARAGGRGIKGGRS